MMAEFVNDGRPSNAHCKRTVDATEDDLVAQARQDA
jgi:hypothetical protein